MRSISMRVAIALLAVIILFAPAPARAQYGHTEGGFGGLALGAMGGSAAGSAIVAAAGIANPLLGGAVVATSALAGSYAGAKLGSKAGNTIDNLFTSQTVWTTVGAVTGGLAGFLLGPGGGMVGKVVGAGIGAALGAWAGHHFSSSANSDFNPRTVGALIGGVNGAAIAGPVGAAVGVPVGYIAGDFLNNHVFSNDAFDTSSWSSSNSNYHQYIPPASSNTYSPDGYDREGYDRLGYDRQGYDREGYDRFGYDKNGRDRQGYNRNGFGTNAPGITPQPITPQPGASPTPITSTYDPGLYNAYWQQWGETGGPYPTFDSSHWADYPPATRQVAQDRYTQAAGAASPTSTDLVQLKQAYMQAVDNVQRLATSGASDADKAAALQQLKTAEAALAAECKAEGIQK